MATASEIWIFCLIFLLIFATSTAQDETTEVTITTTTESSGTITIQVWIIYAIIAPVLGIAAIIALLLLCRWLCSKRHVSVLPKTEPENKRIVNDLNNDNEAKTKPFDHFVVSHESRKISKKPKKAINCLLKKDQTQSAAHETEPGIERLKKTIDLVTEERNRTDDGFQGDAASENAFNHSKEESAPREQTRQSQLPHATTQRSESLINTFKLENENAEKNDVVQSKSLTNTSQPLWSRRRRKHKESAIKRNMKLIKSKLNRPDTDSTDDTSDETSDASSSTVYTSSEEESMIDPSFVPSGDEDAITDDEDSGTDHVTSRHSKRQKMDKETSKEAKKGTLKSRVVNGYNTQELTNDDSPTADAITRKLTRRNSKNSKPNETCIQSKSSKDSKDLTQKEVILQNPPKASRCESSVAVLTSELSADNETKQKTSTCSNNKLMKTIIKSTFEHAERQGPLATSSFKSNGEEKAGSCKGEKKQQKQTVVANETSHSSNTNIYDFVKGKNVVKQENNDSEKKSFENYKEFEETVMKRRKINLNRSVSLTETDIYKDEMNTRRRKRKYQSLRQTRKESVFDALQTLEMAPKKGILKASKSLYLKNDNSENALASRFEGGTKEEQNKEMKLPYVHFTENIDTCNEDNGTSERFNGRSLSKDNAKVPSKSYPVNIPENESNTSYDSNNETAIDDDIGENRKYGFTKPQRNTTLEPNDTETKVVVVMSRDIRVENKQDKTGNENDNISEIVSSNLFAKPSDMPGIVSLEDAEILDFTRQPDMLSAEPNASSTCAVERLSPVLTLTSEREQNTLVEANKKCCDSHEMHIMEKTNSKLFSDNDSETNFIINTDIEYYDEKEHVTFRRHHATSSCDEQKLENTKMSGMLNDLELSNISTGKEMRLFQIKNQSFLYEDRTQSKLSSHQTIEHREYLTEENMVKDKDEESKQFEDSQIYVSERGLIYSKNLETDKSKTAPSSPTAHVTDQNLQQRPPSTLNSADPDYTLAGTLDNTEKPSMKSVSPYSDVYVEDVVTANLETKQVQIPMFIRRQTMNELYANDHGAISHEPTRRQAECPSPGFADIQMSTSLPVEHANFGQETHHTHSSQKDAVSPLSLSNEVRRNLPVQNERANTPILTSECLKRPPFQLKSVPHKIERPKSNLLFDNIGVETTPLETERSVYSSIQTSGLTRPISQSKSTKTLSPIAKKDASQDSPMSPSPDIHEGFTTQENPHKNDFMSLNAHSKQRRFVIREDGKNNQVQTLHQVWTENPELQNKSFTHSSSVKQPAQKPDIPFAEGRKLKRANVLIPLMKDEHKTSERENDFSKDEIHIDGRLEQAKVNKDSTTRKVFSFRNQSNSARSKTPSVEMERSPKYPMEQKRSKTPLPVPTYIRSNTGASLKKTLADDLKPNQQTHHIESFSRNFLHFPADRRQFMRPDHQKSISISSLRNKQSNTFVYGKHDSNANTLLNRRAKENNTLSGRMNSRKPSERERPKSAMSLRSAPWPTTMETFRTIKAGNRNKQTRESFVYYDTEVDNKLNVEHTNHGHTDSDSELEAFFANPDAEVLQFDN